MMKLVGLNTHYAKPQNKLDMLWGKFKEYIQYSGLHENGIIRSEVDVEL